MLIFDYGIAKLRLEKILKLAFIKGEVMIRDKKGKVFVLKPSESNKSPFDNIEGINLDISKEEILDFIKEGRRNF